MQLFSIFCQVLVICFVVILMGHPRLLFLYFRSFQTILFYEALSFVVTIGVTFCFTVIGATIWCLILGVAILVSFWEQTLLVLRLDNYATTVIIVVIDAPVVTGVAVEVVVVVLLCSGVHSNEEKEWDFYSKDSHRWMTTQMSHFSSFRRFSFFSFFSFADLCLYKPHSIGLHSIIIC